jgi:hypothetical protein
VLKYGSAKARFTANAIYHQTLVVQAAQVVKVAVQKAVPVSITAEVVTKEAVSAVANADKAIADKAATTVVVAKTEAVVITVKVVHQEDNNRKLN